MHRDFDSNAPSMAHFARRALVAAGIVALIVLAWRLADVFVLIFGAILLATALRALSDPLDRYTPLSGRWSLAVVVLLLIGGLVVAGWTVGGQVALQLRELSDLLPDAIGRVRTWLERSPLGPALVDLAQRSAEAARGAVSGIARFATTTLGALANTVLMVFLALYLAADPGLYRRGLIRLVPHAGRERAAQALDAAGFALKRWLLGQLMAMVIVGLITGVGLWLLGIPLALSLGLIAGVLEFVPFVGPILSAIPAILVAFTQGGMTPLYVVLLYLAVQQIEGNVLMPLIQRWAVSLPPALGLIGVVVFGLLFGVLGVLFATPLMVVVMVLTQKLYVEAALRDGPQPTPTAPPRRSRRQPAS
jgi:predicted PurR-regulated permease PerM